MNIDIAERDIDVALSDRGAEQAAVGEWLRGLGSARSSVVLSSPYVRAAWTAEIAVGVAQIPVRSCSTSGCANARSAGRDGRASAGAPTHQANLRR